ncbi:hypothetical protein NK8_71340 (plasmid) [Caballeronia sp. NK8]|uniref:carboxypeptidase-like regulatory domain-containing protein n=1 Tax=Caballeronia sp. NK8 TaxID=140098 RepID=UPI001BB53EBC|nr:carboxypeptidase-like regulatory domain-containing protein [Caballeronia sp. NK8]BCQ28944.1 hypothetical protein NK8_71340 [Caballeronia sp. NK8]
MRIVDRPILRTSLGIALLFGAHTALSQPLPEPVSRDGMLFVTGGVGIDEAKAFQAAAPRYSLRLTFATPSGSYLSDVDVTVATDAGRPMLHARTDGPFLFIMLPAGRYRIVVNRGGADVNRLVTVPPRGGVQLNVLMPDTPVSTAARRCPRCSASAEP